MCGRYVQSKKARDYARLIAIRGEAAAPRPETWNLAPSTPSLVVRANGEGLLLDWLTWGFGEGKLKPINARLETVAQKPYFSGAWRSQRCLVPVDGWYEWKVEAGRKQPYYFQRVDGEPIFFGGLWARGGTFTLLTTAVQGHLSLIHHRRPVTVRNSEAAEWIATPVTAKMAESFCVPEPDIKFYPVNGRVSSTRNDDRDLIAEVMLPTSIPLNMELFPHSE